MKRSVLTRVVASPQRLAALGLLAAGMLAVALLAQATPTVPFKGMCIGAWAFDNGVIAHVSGNGTHIGRFTGQLYGDMTVVLRTPDGSEVSADITPKSTGGGVAVITGGTGRFEGATGYWESTWNLPDGTPTGWIETFDGQISTVGSNKT